MPETGSAAAEPHLASVEDAIAHYMAPEQRNLATQLLGGGGEEATADSSTASMASGGFAITPKRGDALLWYNYDEAGALETRAVHCAMPVKGRGRQVGRQSVHHSHAR